MTNDKVNEVLQKLVEHFAEDNQLPRRYNAQGYNPGPDAARSHGHWMALEALSWGQEKLGKKMRWLGFVQAIVWYLDALSIESLKKDNVSEELCAHCQKNPLAYPGAKYCGAGCSASAEADRDPSD